MAPSLSITPCGEADAPLIQELAGRIWREHYPGIITPGQIEYMLEKMYQPRVIAAEMRDQGYVYALARVDGQPAGFLAFVLLPAGKVKLSKLYLEASRRGRGLGRSMLAYVVESARKLAAEEIFLYVNKHNETAIRAYTAFGFVVGEPVVTDIGGGFVMDDYVMRLTLA